MSMAKSEIAQLKEQMRLEYEAARRGIIGLSSGTTRHQFISARMENLGVMHEQLTALVGQAEAIKILAETFEKS